MIVQRRAFIGAVASVLVGRTQATTTSQAAWRNSVARVRHPSTVPVNQHLLANCPEYAKRVRLVDGGRKFLAHCEWELRRIETIGWPARFEEIKAENRAWAEANPDGYPARRV